ncbi:copper resistance protein CopC [Streptomyces sp. 71268]|uniref:copper resistance CopC/CopD family protein n=1 Tax=Streptomyces sp. 71268 TaxID=3002640 RepID=UPI0023F90313|nr:copper resistance protein CopC [Streptomyces sp. 71268]WEV26639.1 copper resistance protein CopC [Streptomyces sp. 71268]
MPQPPAQAPWDERSAVPARPGAPRARRALTVLGALLAALLCALGAGASPAAAHAALTGTDPAKDAVLQRAPERVTLTFSEGVLLSDDSVRVLDPQGERVDDGKPAHVAGKSSTATVGLRSGLPEGTFTVAWQAVSEDSHPVGGAFTFSIGAPSKTSVVLPSAEPDGTVSALYGIARYAAYGGFVLLVGGCVFAGHCHANRAVRRVAATGWGTLFGATVALLLLRGPYTSNGRGLGAAFDLGLVRDVLDTKPGTALLCRLLLLAAAAVCVAVLFGSYAPAGDGRARGGVGRPARPARGGGRTPVAGPALAGRTDLAWSVGVGGALVAGGLAATWALAEHASVGIQRTLAVPVDIVHLLAVAVWLGGLTALLVALRTEARLPRLAVRRFSRLAFGSVVALVVTGLYQSWRQVGSWHALTDTEYGRWLLVKVGLVVLLVGAAGLSRRWTSRLDTTPDTASSPRGAATTAKGTGKATNRAAGKAAATAEAKAKAASEAKAASRAKPETEPEPSPETKATAKTKGTAGAKAKPGGTPGTKPKAKPGVKAKATGGDARAAQLARQRAAVSAARTRRERDADPTRSGLRRSVAVETGVAVVLLAVTTVLTGTQPGRAETEQEAAGQSVTTGPVSLSVPYDTEGLNGRGTAEVTLDPGRSGDNTFHAYLTNPAGKPADVPELKASLTLRERGIGPLGISLNRVSAGHWSATGVQLPMPGDWQLSLTVRTSDIDQVTETDTMKVGP